MQTRSKQSSMTRIQKLIELNMSSGYKTGVVKLEQANF